MLDQTIHEMPASSNLSGSSPIKRRKARAELKSIGKLPKRRTPSKRANATCAMTPTPIVPTALDLSRDEGGQSAHDDHIRYADLIASIRGAHRQRQDFHRAEKSLTLQIKAIERRLSGAVHDASPWSATPREPLIENGEGHVRIDTRREDADVVLDLNEEGDEGHLALDSQFNDASVAFFATEPLALARAAIKPHRMKAERECQKMAKKLRVWLWVDAINGFGALGLAQIVGEAGDLSLYSNPAKLWKRFGLAVFDGKSQRRVSGAAAIEQGYSPVRRAIMFCIGDSLLKKQNAYRELYLARKVTEQAKLPEGTKMHWHRRAQRYTEKRLLRNLWRAWRDQRFADTHHRGVSLRTASTDSPAWVAP